MLVFGPPSFQVLQTGFILSLSSLWVLNFKILSHHNTPDLICELVDQLMKHREQVTRCRSRLAVDISPFCDRYRLLQARGQRRNHSAHGIWVNWAHRLWVGRIPEDNRVSRIKIPDHLVMDKRHTSRDIRYPGPTVPAAVAAPSRQDTARAANQFTTFPLPAPPGGDPFCGCGLLAAFTDSNQNAAGAIQCFCALAIVHV